MMKAYSKLGTEENFLNLIKDIYPKNATGNVLTSEQTLPLRQGTSHGFPLTITLNILMEVLPNEIKEIKVHRSRKNKNNFC